jgi:ComF family protein
MSIPHTLDSLLGDCLDCVFPAACFVCNEQWDSVHRDYRLCQECLEGLVSNGNSCARCSAPTPASLGEVAECPNCKDSQWSFRRAYSLGAYSGLLKNTVVLMKRPFYENLALRMGFLLATRILAQADVRYDCVMATPQHWWRRIIRRTNSSEHLAESIAKSLSIPFQRTWLVRSRSTKKQGLLGVEHRRRNVQGAFRVARRASLENKNILLVDDILTTGSTAHEMAKVLRRSGAALVDVAVMARSLV